MHPAEYHTFDRDERLRQLSGLSIDLGNYLSDAYDALAGRRTQALLKALRHGVELVGLQGGLRAAEWGTAVSSSTAIPFRSDIWVPVDLEAGEGTLKPAPYRILGAVPAITGQSEWLGADYDPQTGTLSVPTPAPERVWIPEARYASPPVREYVQNILGSLSLQASYPPPHRLHLTRLFERIDQEGLRPQHLSRLAHAAYGVPFAYGAGVIDRYEKGDWPRVIIRQDEGTEIASFLPASADISSDPLQSPGETVEAGDPLLTTIDLPSFSGQAAQSYGRAVRVEETSVPDGKIVLRSTPMFNANQRVRLTVVAQSYRETQLVRRISGQSLFVEGAVAPVRPEDWAVVEPITLVPSGLSDVSISLSSPYPPTPLRHVREVCQRVTPPGLPLTISAD